MNTNATDLLRRLSPDQIRQRLATLAAEGQALRSLLRAVIRMQAGQNNGKGETR
jgi:hypothetical protein